MAKTTEQMERLVAIAADDAHPLQRTAQAALRKLTSAQAAARRPTAHQRATIQRYRVGGVWKTTQRLCDYVDADDKHVLAATTSPRDAEIVNGYSDKTGAVSHGKTLRPVHTQPAPALAPEPKYEQKPGWGFIQDRERSPKQALLDSRAFTARTGS